MSVVSVDVATHVSTVSFSAHEAAIEHVRDGAEESGQDAWYANEVAPREEIGCSMHRRIPLVVSLHTKQDDCCTH